MKIEEAKLILNHMDARFDDEADKLFIESGEVDALIDKIYDGRKCKTCRHLTKAQDWCNEIEHGFPIDYIGGCDKWEEN